MCKSLPGPRLTTYYASAWFHTVLGAAYEETAKLPSDDKDDDDDSDEGAASGSFAVHMDVHIMHPADAHTAANGEEELKRLLIAHV